MNELPVWSSDEVERSAVAVAALCREVGAVAWAVALAVLLVDGTTVAAFREQQPAVWASFVQMLHADVTFSYLWDILEVLSGAADGGGQEEGLAAAVEGLQLGAPGGQAEGAGLLGSEAFAAQAEAEAMEEVAAGVGAGVMGPGTGGLQLTASAGRVELRPLGLAGGLGEIQAVQEERT